MAFAQREDVVRALVGSRNSSGLPAVEVEEPAKALPPVSLPNTRSVDILDEGSAELGEDGVEMAGIEVSGPRRCWVRSGVVAG